MARRVQGGGQAEEGARTDRTQAQTMYRMQALKQRQTGRKRTTKTGRKRSTKTFARTD
jgi:hypothetical protein